MHRVTDVRPVQQVADTVAGTTEQGETQGNAVLEPVARPVQPRQPFTRAGRRLHHIAHPCPAALRHGPIMPLRTAGVQHNRRGSGQWSWPCSAVTDVVRVEMTSGFDTGTTHSGTSGGLALRTKGARSVSPDAPHGPPLAQGRPDALRVSRLTASKGSRGRSYGRSSPETRPEGF